MRSPSTRLEGVARFPISFDHREPSLQRGEDLDWLTASHGPLQRPDGSLNFTSYDLCSVIKRWLRASGRGHLSVCEVLLAEDCPPWSPSDPLRCTIAQSVRAPRSTPAREHTARESARCARAPRTHDTLALACNLCARTHTDLVSRAAQGSGTGSTRITVYARTSVMDMV